MQDKLISRDEELSDSEDEGDGRRNENNSHHHGDNKRSHSSDEGGGRESKPQAISKATGGNGVSIESPVPPEPSPITPGPVNQSHQLTEVEETEEDKAERS